MDDVPNQDRDALVALLDRTLQAETQTEPPLPADRGNWLYGSGGYTDPDEHGWMAPMPQIETWVPRALVFWRMAVLAGAPVSDDQMCDCRYSLTRWPAVEAAVGRIVAAGGA